MRPWVGNTLPCVFDDCFEPVVVIPDALVAIWQCSLWRRIDQGRINASERREPRVSVRAQEVVPPKLQEAAELDLGPIGGKAAEFAEILLPRPISLLGRDQGKVGHDFRAKTFEVRLCLLPFFKH